MCQAARGCALAVAEGWLRHARGFRRVRGIAGPGTAFARRRRRSEGHRAVRTGHGIHVCLAAVGTVGITTS